MSPSSQPQEGAALPRSFALVFFLASLPALGSWSCGGEPEVMYQGQPTSEWIAMLGDADPGAQLQAMDALAAIGPSAGRAVPDLLDRTEGSNAEMKVAAVKALLSIGEPTDEVVDRFIDLLSDGDLALWNRSNERWADSIIDNLDIPDPVRRRVEGDAAAMGHCSMTATGLAIMEAFQAVEALGPMVTDDSDPARARCAIYTLTAMGALAEGREARQVLTILAPAVNHPSEAIWDMASNSVTNLARTRARSGFGDAAEFVGAAIEILREGLLEVEDSQAVFLRVNALASFAGEEVPDEVVRPAVEGIVSAFHFRDAWIGHEAILQVGAMARDGRPELVADVALDELIAVLEESDEDFLQRHDRHSQAYLPPEAWAQEPGRAITQAMFFQQLDAIKTLGHLGPAAADALSALEQWAAFDDGCATVPRYRSDDPVEEIRRMRCQLPRHAQEAMASIQGA